MSQPKIMIVEARFYEDLADEMAAGAIAAIEACGGTYERFAVPGAFEIRRRSNLPFEAWILTRAAVGLTVMLPWAASSEGKPRITIMSAARARGLTDLANQYTLAIGYGILTTENREQAWARASRDAGNKGPLRRTLALI